MVTIRNVGGVALFLRGTAFLWITPAFASRGVSTEGTLWAVTRVLALAAMAGFLVATVGLLRRDAWWETVAVLTALDGLVAAAVCWVVACRAGETTAWLTAFVRAVVCCGLLLLFRVPRMQESVDH